MARWEVLVGNVGVVYDGEDERRARLEYQDYRIISQLGMGRAGGEPVRLFCDNNIIEEWEGESTDGEV